MKKKNRGLSVRIMTALLSVLLLMGLFPYVNVSAATAEEILSVFDSSAPSEYKAGENPYGYATNQEFLMAAQNELLLLRSHNAGNIKNNWYSGFNAGSFNGNDSSAKLQNIDESSSPFSSSGSYSSQKSYPFTNAVAFDPMGTGRDDHVAYIGFNPDGEKSDGSGEQGEIVVYVMNVNSGVTSVAYHGGWAPYMKDKDFEQFEVDSLFAITAGKYTDSDKETFVVYIAGEDGTYTLQEWKVTTSNSQSIYLSCIGESKNLLHTEYVNTCTEMAKTNRKENMLHVSLETGDFNGDRIDDLAVLSYIDEPTSEYWGSDFDDVENHREISAKVYSPQLKIARGGGSGSVLSDGKYVKDKLIRQSENSRTFTTMYGCSVSAGDVDGDGVDELVAAGYERDVYHNSDVISGVYYDLARLVTIWEFLENHITELLFEQHDYQDTQNKIYNIWTSDAHIEFSGEYGINRGECKYDKKIQVIPQFKTECVALNGDSNPEYIFLNGTLCTFENGKLEHKYTPSVFNNEPAKYSSFGAKFGFIDSMAVGVFDSNTVGREQIIISMGLLADNGDDDYHYFLGVVGGRNYNDTVRDGVTVEYGTLRQYYTTRFYQDDEYTEYMKKNNGLFDRGANYDERLNCVLVAIDRGKDGTMARYSGKGYTFSNPNLISVLQAAPYYSDFGSYGDSATTYEFSTTYTISEQSAASTSFSVGVSTEMEAPGLKFAIGGGYMEGFTRSFEQSFTETHTTAFTAKEENQVVLQRTPIVIYNYELQNSKGEWTDTIQITVPCAPSYVLMTVEEYNSFAKAYNSTIKAGRFTEIKDSALLGNAGNPKQYDDSFGSKITRLSTGTYVMNMSSGSMTSTYEKGSEDTTGITTKQGYYVDTFIGTGAGFTGGSIYGGVETSISGDTSYGTFETTGQYRKASGTVYGIGELKNKIPENILSQYGFNWSFGTWMLSMAGGLDLPVYGYVVNPVAQPAASPANFSVTDSGDEAKPMTVSFSKVDNATGYTLYMLDSTNEYKVFANINSGNSNTISGNYSFPDGYRDISITLAVTATVDGKETAMSPSITYYKENGAITAYEIAVANGFEGTVEEWLDSLVGEDGKDGKDGVGISDVYINPSTGELTVIFDNGTEKALGDVTGSDGVDGRGIDSLFINENGELIVNLTDNSQVNLGVVTGQDGEDGNGISDISKTSTEGLVDTYTITYTDGTTTTFKVTNGEQGEQGIQGIQGEKGEDGHTPIITIQNGYWYIDGVSTNQSAQGVQGETGNGISEISKTSTAGLVDTYTITYTDGTTTTFKVTNGEQGEQGIQGIQGEKGEDGHTPVITVQNGYWYIDGVNTNQLAQGLKGDKGDKGDTGVGVADAKIDDQGNFIVTLTDGTVINTGNILDILTPKEPNKILGDSNGDDTVSVKDATLIQKYVADMALIEQENLKCSDVNADTVINVKDATAIQMHAVNIKTVYPIGILMNTVAN